VHYRLTELGFSLTGPTAVLREWAELNMASIDDAGIEWDRQRGRDT
jgi:DNA-binding HxlR family transcriptional regulator